MDIPRPDKADYFDYYDVTVSQPLPAPGRANLGLAEDFRFVRQLTDQPVKLSITGPFSLAHRIRTVPGGAYADRADLVRALARVLAAEAAELARAGARVLQIDEPFLAGYPEDVELAIEAVNIVTEAADVSWTLHVCYGNRYARPLWEGHYDFLFPAVKEANVGQLALEFAENRRRGPRPARAAPLGPRPGARRDRREDRAGGVPGPGRGADPAGAALRGPGEAGDQSRLRAASPAARHRPR